jgi:hypothetical protein
VARPAASHDRLEELERVLLAGGAEQSHRHAAPLLQPHCERAKGIVPGKHGYAAGVGKRALRREQPLQEVVHVRRHDHVCLVNARSASCRGLGRSSIQSVERNWENLGAELAHRFHHLAAA